MTFVLIFYLLLDLQPGNILLSNVGSSDSEVSLEPAEFSLVKWIDESEMDDSAPKYLIPSQRARGALDELHESSLAIKIGDFGGGRSSRFCGAEHYYD